MSCSGNCGNPGEGASWQISDDPLEILRGSDNNDLRIAFSWWQFGRLLRSLEFSLVFWLCSLSEETLAFHWGLLFPFPSEGFSFPTGFF